MKKKKIVVQIPCLNEEKGLPSVIQNLKTKIPSCRIIVYDNGSDDNSVQVAIKRGAEVRHIKKKGKGNVVRSMFSDQIEADYFIMIDGDNTYDVSKLNEMIDLMSKFKYDMIIGRRIHKDSMAYRKGHVMGNRFFSNFVNLFPHSGQFVIKLSSKEL